MLEALIQFLLLAKTLIINDLKIY